jgi:tetratricopeptide (TPR) repeat protein
VTPRTLSDSQTPANGLHEPFLQRAADADAEPSSSHALGAFLTMRLVDQFTADRTTLQTDALAYQIRATSDFLRELHPPTVEGNHLLEIVRVADGVRDTRNVRLLWPPLLAFSFWLENQLRLPEALDVLETSLRISRAEVGEEDVAAHLQLGRVLRLSGKFAEAREAYARAGRLASRLGDTHSTLLSRIGQAIVVRFIGNLPESERMLLAVLRDAREQGDEDAEARACHDLSAAYYYMGRHVAAVQLAFEAFRLYGEQPRRTRALADMGMVLRELGHYSVAKRALLLALDYDPPMECRVRTVVELVDLAALMQDRISFERWRREADTCYDHMPPDERVEFEIKLGTGLAAFERWQEGEDHLRRAMALAEDRGLGEQLFRAEAQLREVQEGRDAQKRAATVPTEVDPAPELEPTIASLEALASER